MFAGEVKLHIPFERRHPCLENANYACLRPPARALVLSVKKAASCRTKFSDPIKAAFFPEAIKNINASLFLHGHRHLLYVTLWKLVTFPLAQRGLSKFTLNKDNQDKGSFLDFMILLHQMKKYDKIDDVPWLYRSLTRASYCFLYTMFIFVTFSNLPCMQRMRSFRFFQKRYLCINSKLLSPGLWYQELLRTFTQSHLKYIDLLFKPSCTHRKINNKRDITPSLSLQNGE